MPVQISEHTRQILIRFMPKWMGDLSKVDFNMQKLGTLLIDRMENSPACCFIGEGRKNYVEPDKNEYCDICTDLSMIAPAMFGSTDDRYKKYFSQSGSWYSFSNDNLNDLTYKEKKVMFNDTDQGKANFLTFTAEHFLKSHEVIA